MSLLELERVVRCDGRGVFERVVLRDVCLELDAGEMVAIWGLRRSGRSTLLRIAAGVEAPDSGMVRFDGCDLQGRDGEVARGAIGYCAKGFNVSSGELVIEQLLVDQLTRGVSARIALRRAHAALERLGVEQCCRLRPGELDSAEAVRVAIARALARQPQLLVMDEPLLGVDLLARDEILRVLRSLADEGLAVLTSDSEATGLAGADRALSLSEGDLHGSTVPTLAPVLPLRAVGQ